MEPQLPTPHGSPEVGPPMQQPEMPARQGVEFQGAPERQQSYEQRSAAPDSSVPAAPPTAPVAPIIPNPTPVVVADPVGDDAPAVAADEDLIEKEWVEKAKKVITETKHDPYLQERAVSKLQADYLQKRYGKTVKLPEEG